MKNNESLSLKDFRRNLSQETQAQLQDIIILQEVGSTNDYLFSLDVPQRDQAIVCMAEQQTTGKGTKGRVWHSRFGASLIYSIAWSFAKPTKDLSALSLAVGVVAQQALAQQGYDQVRLKWPNDLLVGRAKLGGILIEVKPKADRLHLVCGIGINILSALDEGLIDQAFTALDRVDENKNCSRNTLAANLTDGLIELFSTFPTTGFKPWQEPWQAAHALQNKSVNIEQFGQTLRGIAKGVDASGALLFEHNGEVKKIISATIAET